MTLDRMDVLYRHAADLGLDIIWRDLGDVRRGEYRDDDGLIVLNTRLTRAQGIDAAAHEVGHGVWGDRCSTQAKERRADETGASLIISRRDYESAEAEVGEHPGALAVVLEVTPRMIHSWRRWWARQPESAAD